MKQAMELFSTEVKLGKEIPPSDLEKMLVEAAQEVGWEAKVADNLKKEYQLGSLQEREIYESSTMQLRGRIRPKFRVTYWKDKPTNERVLLYTPLVSWLSHVTEQEVKHYLQALSQRVQAYQPQEAAP